MEAEQMIAPLTEEKPAGLMKGCWVNEQMTVVLRGDFTHSTYLQSFN